MTNNLLKNLMAAYVIVFTFGVSGAWAEEFKSKLPKCKGEYSSSWNNCYGKQKFINGSYEGEFKNALYNGKGIFKLNTGEQYIGEFKDMLKHGYGTWIGVIGSSTQLNGEIDFNAGLFGNEVKAERYVGQFKNGMKEGKGTYIYASGTEYKGDWKEDFPNGYGVKKILSNYLAEGNWINGNEDGVIKTTHVKDKNYLTINNYNNGIQHGEQILRDNKIYFIQNFNNGIEEGLFYWSNDYDEGIGKNIKKINGSYLQSIKKFGFIVRSKDGQRTFSLENEDNKIIHLKKINEKIIIGTLTENKFLPFENQEHEALELKKLINKIKLTDANFFKINENKYSKKIDKDLLQYLGLEEIFDEYKNKLSLHVTNTKVNAEGDFVINIQTGVDTASLKINGEELGGRADGNYAIKKVARAGQETKFTIVAKDINGNTDSKTISVARQVTASAAIKYAELNPALVKTQPNKDAVAIIIGIADYKNLPRADYANDDARAFYDYAIRGLGVRAENIKLLVDGDAGQGEILKTFKTWLPTRVKPTTDVYVYYSGHGLPSADGQTLYILPQQADRDLIEDTAVAQSRINAAIQAAKPKSVTIFLDSCYSGAARTGQTLLASARPISLKANTQNFPSDFTVFTASTAEQISSSSNELKHGIFSYYLMRGMEGDADTNKDGKITAGEMHSYLMDNVARQASLANRVQNPQLAGDANRVLVGR